MFVKKDGRGNYFLAETVNGKQRYIKSLGKSRAGYDEMVKERNSMVTQSLRAAGITSLPCDIPTRAKIKQLAGDMPVSHYLRLIAERELRNRPGALPGMENYVSDATLPVIGANTAKAVNLLSTINILLTQRPTPEQIRQLEVSQLSFLSDKEIVSTGKAAGRYMRSLFDRLAYSWRVIKTGKIEA